MTLQCAPPDPDLGVALRLAGYLDCQSRALGENGFQTLAGGPVIAAILSALIAIFIALIGYRMILSTFPSLRDGVGWAVRLGLVLALVTSWPAFQTLVYNVATDGPEELAAILLPAAGLPAASVDDRIQAAYDVIRLGGATRGNTSDAIATGVPQGSASAANAAPSIGPGLVPLPQTASLLVLSTMGVTAALRLAVGFLIAIGPLGILCLLFEGTLGIFSGWVRALAGAALGVLAASIASAIELVMVETEIVHAQEVQTGAATASSLDPQALVTIILIFSVVALALVGVAFRVASAFRLSWIGHAGAPADARRRQADGFKALARASLSGSVPGFSERSAARTRADAVADALTSTVYREQAAAAGGSASGSYARRMTMSETDRAAVNAAAMPLGAAARRSTSRRTRTAGRRDSGQ